MFMFLLRGRYVVMSKFEFVAEESEIRIDKYIVAKFNDYSRNFIQKLINDGDVKVNDCAVRTNYKVKLNDRIEINIKDPEKLDVLPQDIDIEVVYEDNDIVVVNVL